MVLRTEQDGMQIAHEGPCAALSASAHHLDWLSCLHNMGLSAAGCKAFSCYILGGPCTPSCILASIV